MLKNQLKVISKNQEVKNYHKMQVFLMEIHKNRYYLHTVQSFTLGSRRKGDSCHLWTRQTECTEGF